MHVSQRLLLVCVCHPPRTRTHSYPKWTDKKSNVLNNAELLAPWEIQRALGWRSKSCGAGEVGAGGGVERD